MPSKRPSPSAMDAGAAASSPSPPRSKKRSSRPNPRMDDDRPEPNPSSRGSPAGASSRKSERKRRPRAFTDSAAVTARTGHAPRLTDMGALFDSIRGSLSPHLDQAKVYYKLKRLKSKFLHSAPAATGGPHERRVRDLCADLWGAELAPPVEADAYAEEGDADEGYIGGDVEVAVRLPVVSEVLDEYWRRNARALSGVSLEKGLALLRAEEGRVAETKWRRQLGAEMRTQVRRHDLAKEVYGLLIDAVKGLGP